MSENWRKAGWAGAAIGVIAAGAAAGVAVERITVGRGIRMKARLALDAAGDYGSLRGTEGVCRAEDGTELYYETDELPPAPPARSAVCAARPRPPGPPSSSATATASARTPGTSSAPRCAESSGPSTGTSAATAAAPGAWPRPTASR